MHALCLHVLTRFGVDCAMAYASGCGSLVPTHLFLCFPLFVAQDNSVWVWSPPSTTPLVVLAADDALPPSSIRGLAVDSADRVLFTNTATHSISSVDEEGQRRWTCMPWHPRGEERGEARGCMAPIALIPVP